MKGFYVERSSIGDWVRLRFGAHFLQSWCYRTFIKHHPRLKLKPGEKIPVNIKITRRRKWAEKR